MGITSRHTRAAGYGPGLVALTVAGSLALAGCGSSSSSSASSTTSAAGASSASGGHLGAPRPCRRLVQRGGLSSAAGSSSAASAKASAARRRAPPALGPGHRRRQRQVLRPDADPVGLRDRGQRAGQGARPGHQGLHRRAPGRQGEVRAEVVRADQLQRLADPQLRAARPDVMEYNKGNATSGLLSKQGLLTDLTPEVSKFGWDKLLSPSLQVTAKYDPTGSMGSGKWYGVPTYGEFVFVYYNKDHVREVRASRVPTTLADFETDLAKFKAAGITPIANGGAEYPTQQIFYELSLSKANQQFVNDFQLYHHRGQLPGTRVHLRRDDPAGLGQQGLHREEHGQPQGAGHGRRLRGAEEPDHDLGHLVVRHPRQRDQELQVGHLPVPRQHLQRRLQRQPVGRPVEGQEQGPRVRLHQHHPAARTSRP